ncbi:MAG: hypothetical protein QOD81_2410 [Solirubrobacteraceae bacterium]|jgi:hypothetical protein|nr:hypothetical protein [Solirubrobacteraceae bacterium]
MVGVIACVVALAAAAGADAATVSVPYTPFTPSGSLAPGIRATPQFGGTCSTGSFVVSGPTVFRCVAGDLIHDPCYLDVVESSPERPVAVCVTAPWVAGVVRLRLVTAPARTLGAPPGGPPWALRLASGRRCLRATGATSVVRGLRLSYVCEGRRVLFGTPARSASTWRIRQATTAGGHMMRSVAIVVAWS